VKYSTIAPIGIGLALFLLTAQPAWSQFDAVDPNAESGKAIFLHQWQPNDKLSPNGDGLGPLFNAKSCVACHRQGGVGGSGNEAVNTDVLAILVDQPLLRRMGKKRLFNTLHEIHPNFVVDDETFLLGIPLHRESTSAKYAKIRQSIVAPLPWQDWSDTQIKRFLRKHNLENFDDVPFRFVSRIDNIQLAITQRNTPALFGLDDIDRKVGEGEIAEIAKQQRKLGFEGRQLGKFGWRGQLNKLDEFIKGACANELGLQVHQHEQPKDPLAEEETLFGVDLSKTQTEHLVAYVRSLPAPRQILPEDDDAKSRVAAGELAFNEVKCNACHVKRVGLIDDVYSDFLVHDMGPKFEDPIPAEEEDGEIPLPELPEPIPLPSFGGYGGGGAVNTTFDVAAGKRETDRRKFREWKTPPLWGVADSAPYMHDGRAGSLFDAILMHDGDAAKSRIMFEKLSTAEQANIIEFLSTLKAPQAAEVAPVGSNTSASSLPQTAQVP